MFAPRASFAHTRVRPHRYGYTDDSACFSDWKKSMKDNFAEGLQEGGVVREYVRPSDSGEPNRQGTGGRRSSYSTTPYTNAGHEWHYNQGKWVPMMTIMQKPEVHGYLKSDERFEAWKKQLAHPDFAFLAIDDVVHEEGDARRPPPAHLGKFATELGARSSLRKFKEPMGKKGKKVGFAWDFVKGEWAGVNGILAAPLNYGYVESISTDRTALKKMQTEVERERKNPFGVFAGADVEEKLALKLKECEWQAKRAERVGRAHAGASSSPLFRAKQYTHGRPPNANSPRRQGALP